MKTLLITLLAAFALLSATAAESNSAPRAARSVHLAWQAPEAELFYNEMIVDESVPGSYFMACGWNTGYFGIQELGNGRKVILFSVWDPTRGNNANAVEEKDRVECLFSDPNVRIRRFGGEGTGGQCMGEFNWQPGGTNRFLVRGLVESNKTAYAGYVFDNSAQEVASFGDLSHPHWRPTAQGLLLVYRGFPSRWQKRPGTSARAVWPGLGEECQRRLAGLDPRPFHCFRLDLGSQGYD